MHFISYQQHEAVFRYAVNTIHSMCETSQVLYRRMHPKSEINTECGTDNEIRKYGQRYKYCEWTEWRQIIPRYRLRGRDKYVCVRETETFFNRLINC